MVFVQCNFVCQLFSGIKDLGLNPSADKAKEINQGAFENNLPDSMIIFVEENRSEGFDGSAGHPHLLAEIIRRSELKDALRYCLS